MLQEKQALVGNITVFYHLIVYIHEHLYFICEFASSGLACFRMLLEVARLPEVFLVNRGSSACYRPLQNFFGHM